MPELCGQKGLVSLSPCYGHHGDAELCRSSGCLALLEGPAVRMGAALDDFPRQGGTM